ncbi:hypothetical protein FH972_021886 [Carpinus fangiana]|uniref:Uncharacterized protein n=1 Tax=Carpinus fangiana TaxID=176857 RepID=A0A5N6KQM0_9ROSI|nr:hypothetical protein FH972_021886 [Carpinus fangiana]
MTGLCMPPEEDPDDRRGLEYGMSKLPQMVERGVICLNAVCPYAHSNNRQEEIARRLVSSSRGYHAFSKLAHCE